MNREYVIPAQPGWRVLYLPESNTPGLVEVDDIIAWLVETGQPPNSQTRWAEATPILAPSSTTTHQEYYIQSPDGCVHRQEVKSWDSVEDWLDEHFGKE